MGLVTCPSESLPHCLGDKHQPAVLARPFGGIGRGEAVDWYRVDVPARGAHDRRRRVAQLVEAGRKEEEQADAEYHLGLPLPQPPQRLLWQNERSARTMRK